MVLTKPWASSVLACAQGQFTPEAGLFSSRSVLLISGKCTAQLGDPLMPVTSALGPVVRAVPSGASQLLAPCLPVGSLSYWLLTHPSMEGQSRGS